MSTSIINLLSTEIGQQETSGGTTGVGFSLNNPGAIKFADWETAFGATSTSSGFASFPSLESGWAALNQLVTNYVSGGASISSMLNSYAPVSDGNPTTPARISQIASITGLNPTLPISQQAGSTGSATSTAATAITSALGALGGGILGGGSAGSVAAGAATGAASGAAISSSSGWPSFYQVATFVAGAICLVIGLSMLKQTQFIVQPIVGAAKAGAMGAAALAA